MRKKLYDVSPREVEATAGQSPVAKRLAFSGG
jgi:hypothetical protein